MVVRRVDLLASTVLQIQVGMNMSIAWLGIRQTSVGSNDLTIRREATRLTMEFLSLDLLELGEYLLKIVAAFLLALPVAWERERSTRIMGLRTFPLVSIASCSFVLIAIAVVGAGEDAQARIIQGLMTGIGFIGGGAILKEGATVRGTATAASIWTIGALGAAVGYGRYEIAILLSLANFLVLRLLTPVEEKMRAAEEEQKESGE